MNSAPVPSLIGSPDDKMVLELASSVLWVEPDGIVCVIVKKSPPQPLEVTKQEMEAFKKFTGGKKACLMIDVTHSRQSPKNVRDYLAVEMPKVTKAIAMVYGSALGRMISSIYMGLRPMQFPVRIFSNAADARSWLKQFL